MCQNGQKCYLLNQKKVKQKDSEYKNSSVIRQSYCKITKEKSKLLVKCFVNAFRKNPPISASNVPKLPEMSLFKRRKKSYKRIAKSKLALQQVKLTAKMGRRRQNSSNDWLSYSEKFLQYVLEMCQNCLNVTFWTKRKVTEKDGDLKICCPVGQIDHKNVKNMDKLPSNWCRKSFRKNPPIMR